MNQTYLCDGLFADAFPFDAGADVAVFIPFDDFGREILGAGFVFGLMFFAGFGGIVKWYIRT